MSAVWFWQYTLGSQRFKRLSLNSGALVLKDGTNQELLPMPQDRLSLLNVEYELLKRKICRNESEKSKIKVRRYYYVASQYDVRRCGLLLQTEQRDLSVCLSVCHNVEPSKKPLNRSRCRLSCGIGCVQGSMYSY